MKFLYPKTITIGNYTFNIKYRKNESGGKFDFYKREIILGTKYIESDPGSYFTNILHEITEASYVSMYMRYDTPDALNTYEFHFDHRLFANATEMISKLLGEFIE